MLLGGRGGGLPKISGRTATVEAGSDAGTVVTTLRAIPPGGTWVIESNAYFAIGASTGVVTTTSTPTEEDTTYDPEVTYTVVVGILTIVMTAALAITAVGEVEPEPLTLIGAPPEATIGESYYFKFTRTGGRPDAVTQIANAEGASSDWWAQAQALGFEFNGATDELTATEVLA